MNAIVNENLQGKETSTVHVFEKAGFKRLRSEEPDEVNLQLILQPFWSAQATEISTVE